MPSKTDVLRVKLVADGAGKVKAEMLGVDASFNRVEKSSSRLAGGIRSLSGVFGVLSVAALGGAVKSSIAFADSIDKAAKAAGVGTEFLQEMRFAAEQLGVSNKLVDEGFRRFTRRLGEFVNSGGGPAQKAIEALGVSVVDTQGKFRGSEAVFDDFALAMQGLASDAERSAFAAQIFGDDAGPKLALLLNQGAAGIRNLRQEAQDIGAVLSDDLIDNAVGAQDALSKLTSVLKVQLTSALIQLAPALTSAANGIVELASAARDFFGIGLTPIEEYQKQIDRLASRVDHLRTKLDSPISGLLGTRNELLEEIENTENQIVTLEKAIKLLSETADDDPIGNLPGNMSAAADAADDLEAALAKIDARLNPLQAKATQYAADLATITESNIGLQQQAELIRKLDEEFAKATGGPRELKKSADATSKAIAATGPAAKTAGQEVDQAFKNAAENIQRGFGNTFTDIFRNGEVRFETFTDLIRDMFARLAGEIAALMVFRPSIISGGVGGLGLFGGSAASAAGGGTGSSAVTGTAAGTAGGFLAGGGTGFVNVPGLGPLSVASLQTTALAIGASVAGTFVGNEFSKAVGINTNAGGLAGGLVGGGAGFILSGGNPLGAAIGAAAGNVLGNVIGRAFGVGSGSNKQKFGFSTGTGTGIDSPFGTLAVTREREVDAAAILRSLADIDKNLASLLSDTQIERVRGSLSGTGQNFSVNQFDNEPFDVVKTRLVRIIDAVAENTVASGLLNIIGRDPGNIDQLVGEAQRIIQLISLFDDEGADLNSAEQALKALNDQFSALSDTAAQLGFSLSDVETKRLDAITGLTTDFNTSIREQILAIVDPLTLALEAQERAAQERLNNARTLGADLVEVERLSALERQKVLERSATSAFAGSNSSIAGFLSSLLTGAAGGLSVAQRSSNADTQFSDLLASSRTDPAARQSLASFLPGFVDLKRDQFGSTSAFFEFKSFLDSTLRNLVDQGDTVSTLQDIGEAITDGDNAVIETLRANNDALVAEIADLRADINLLLNAPAAVA